MITVGAVAAEQEGELKNIDKTRSVFYQEEKWCGIDSIDKDAGSIKSTRSRN